MKAAALRARLRTVSGAATAPVATVRVMAWTWTGTRGLRDELRGEGIDAVAAIAPSPAVDDRHRQTVSALLRLLGATCLVRAAILQRWDVDHGHPRDIVIGVARKDAGVAAHAWLAGEGGGQGFVELYRRPADDLRRPTE